jgi:hypothetical protein
MHAWNSARPLPKDSETSLTAAKPKLRLYA